MAGGHFKEREASPAGQTGLHRLDDPVNIVQKFFSPHINFGWFSLIRIFSAWTEHAMGQVDVGHVHFDPYQRHHVMVGMQQPYYANIRYYTSENLVNLTCFSQLTSRFLQQIFQSLHGLNDNGLLELIQEVVYQFSDGSQSGLEAAIVALPHGIAVLI